MISDSSTIELLRDVSLRKAVLEDWMGFKGSPRHGGVELHVKGNEYICSDCPETRAWTRFSCGERHADAAPTSKLCVMPVSFLLVSTDAQPGTQ